MFNNYPKTIMQGILSGLIVATVIMPLDVFADPTVAPSVLGRTMGEWSAKWWQWVLEAPASSNPTLDTTGEFCNDGQRGNVWFLAGVFGGGTAERNCNIPRGKYILFPLTNAFWINSVWDDPNNTEADYRKLANDNLPQPIGSDLEATLDGSPVIFNPKTPIIRAQSPVFTATFPTDNLFGVESSGLTGFPIVSDGFWVILPPLTPGAHVLHFRAGQAQDITYHLTVAEH